MPSSDSPSPGRGIILGKSQPRTVRNGGGTSQTFLNAYNFAKRLKTLNGLTVYEFITQKWTSEPERFRLTPNHLIPGPNIYAAQLSALSQTSIRAAKVMINAMGAPDNADAASFDQVFAESFSGPDFAEGREALLARRKPKFL
jgi:hypothetical protein